MVTRAAYLALLVGVAFGTECVFMTSAEGTDYSYDLSALTRAADNGFTAEGKSEDGVDTYTYSLNVCGLVACGDKPLSPNAAACQAWPYRNEPEKIHHRVLGQLHTQRFSPGLAGVNNGLQVEYSSGDPCSESSGNVNRSVIVQVVCDRNVNNEDATLAFVGETSTCTYQFTLTAAAGCPLDGGETNSPDTGITTFGVLGVIFLVSAILFSVYCCVGIIINRRAGKTEGEQIPNAAFWQAVVKCQCLPK